MANPKLSSTYIRLIDLLFNTNLVSRKQFATRQNGISFERIPTKFNTLVSAEEFYMNASELWQSCTPSEWYMVGRIGAELSYLCALWHCKPGIKNNSTHKKAIKGLIEKKVLFKTETTDIYLVNPNYIRRGDVATVIHTTAYMLQDLSKVSIDIIKDYKPVTNYMPILDENSIKTYLVPTTN